VTVLGAHIMDVLGRPVEEIPPGQGSVRLKEIRATAAGTAAGTGVDLAKLGARVRAVGALGDDLLGDIVIAAMAGHGVDTAGLLREEGAQTSATILPIRPNGERPAFHVPGATRLFTRADVDLDAIQDSRALLIGAPDALAGLTGGDLADIAAAAKSNGVLVAVDVLHPGRPDDLDRLAPLLAVTDWFVPNADQLLALTGRRDLGPGHQGRHRARHHRPGRDRPGLGRRHREPRPGAQLPGAHAAGRGRPYHGRIGRKDSTKEHIS
jgi:sugar/nucleoside kinase (ribokinase family)